MKLVLVLTLLVVIFYCKRVERRLKSLETVGTDVSANCAEEGLYLPFYRQCLFPFDFAMTRSQYNHNITHSVTREELLEQQTKRKQAFHVQTYVGITSIADLFYTISHLQK